jgi:hypothetical protein
MKYRRSSKMKNSDLMVILEVLQEKPEVSGTCALRDTLPGNR